MTFGVDIGTTSVSGVAVGADGKIALSVSIAHKADLPASAAGVFEQDPAKLLAATEAVLSQLGAKDAPDADVGWASPARSPAFRNLRPMAPHSMSSLSRNVVRKTKGK